MSIIRRLDLHLLSLLAHAHAHKAKRPRRRRGCAELAPLSLTSAISRRLMESLKTCHSCVDLTEISNFRKDHNRLTRARLELQKHGIGIGNERRYLSSVFGWLLPEARGCFAQLCE